MRLLRLQDKHGVTLAELTIATILMAIIMLGVLSVDYAMRSMDKTTKDGALTAMRVSTALLRMTKDAERAVGHAGNPGVWGIKDASGYNICFRQDDDNPNSYGDDDWVCYSRPGVERTLYRCMLDNIDNPVSIVPFDCDDYPPKHTILHISNADFFNIASDHIEITLQSRPDPAAAADPLDNPQYEMTTRITPLSKSF